MKNYRSFEKLMKESLGAEYTPDEKLNAALKRRMEDKMVIKKRNSWRVAAGAAAMVVALSATVFAALNLWSPQQVAEEFGLPQLAAAFEEGSGIKINESMTTDEYRISLLGVASGKGLSPLAEGQLDKDKSYSVVAVESLAGALPLMSDDAFYNTAASDLLVSPLIEGELPWQVNLFTMGGGRISSVHDGVLYLLTECDSFEFFADRGVYLAVTNGFISADNYTMDPSTGKISSVEGYDGINLLFSLPLPASKADTQRAEQYLEDLKEGWDEPGEIDDDADSGSSFDLDNYDGDKFTIVESPDQKGAYEILPKNSDWSNDWFCMCKRGITCISEM